MKQFRSTNRLTLIVCTLVWVGTIVYVFIFVLLIFPSRLYAILNYCLCCHYYRWEYFVDFVCYYNCS